MVLWKTPHPTEEGEALEQAAANVDGIAAISASPGAVTSLQPPLQSSIWFAVYTTSRHEKRVAEHLTQREIEHFLPLYRSDRKWSDGSRVTLDLPLFPGYLFVRIQRSERVSVLSVPGALAVVGGTGGEPAPLPDATIDALRTALRLRTAFPHPAVTAGQRVRVRSGALEGLEGIVVRNKNSVRVVMTLEHIVQSYAVEVDITDLEPLTATSVSRASSSTNLSWRAS
jgi:transcription antitermination factor NusG